MMLHFIALPITCNSKTNNTEVSFLRLAIFKYTTEVKQTIHQKQINGLAYYFSLTVDSNVLMYAI